MAGASLPMRSSFCALRSTAVRSNVMGAAASGSEAGDITIQRLELIHVGKDHSRINIPQLQIWLENCAFVVDRPKDRPPRLRKRCCEYEYARLGYFGAMRMAPSSLITSPFSISFSKICRTSEAYSAGRPSRGGNGTCCASDSRAA